MILYLYFIHNKLKITA